MFQGDRAPHVIRTHRFTPLVDLPGRNLIERLLDRNRNEGDPPARHLLGQVLELVSERIRFTDVYDAKLPDGTRMLFVSDRIAHIKDETILCMASQS